MKANFERALDWVLVHEGGFVNHPKDPGGATNRGVTQATYNAYRKNLGAAPRSVRVIEDAEVRDVYKRYYWDKVSGDDLPPGADYAIFDFAVNSGVSRAAKFTQRIVGTTADGVIGANTLGAIADYGSEKLVKQLCHNRFAWLKRLKTFSTFGRGWTRRVMGEKMGAQGDDHGVIDRGVMLAREQAHIPDPIVRKGERLGKADGKDEKGRMIRPEVIAPAGAAVAGVMGQATEGPLSWALAAVLVIAGGRWRLLRHQAHP